MPAAKTTSFKVVEADLAREVLVHALGAPTFLEELNELDEWHPLVRGKVEMAGLIVVCSPSGSSRTQGIGSA